MFEFELSITKALHRDHVATLAMLEKLETALNKQGSSTAPSSDNSEWRSLLSELVAILEADVKGHFAFEESRLFPIFIEYIDPGIPTMLLEEHEVIRPLAETLLASSRQALESGFDAAGWSSFHAQGIELVEREVFHIQKEEMGFLPALEQILESDDDAELSMAYSEAGGAV
jgi:hemerythrin-like domain-containing protein